MGEEYEKQAEELLQGAIDMHVHTAPDVFPRLLNDIEAAEQAKEAGMAGILIKSHVTVTADRAQTAGQAAGVQVFGGVALNLPVGGINPHAVEIAIRLGAKKVWMPTIHAAEFLSRQGDVPMLQSILRPGLLGLTVLADDGSVLPEVDEVLDLAAKNGLAVGTGHLSVKESMVLVSRAKALGVKNIVVTHPLATFVNFSISELKEILEKGATMLEHNFNDMTPVVAHPIQPLWFAQAIKATGAAACIMCSDGGQAENPRPVEMLRRFIRLMLRQGISEKEIKLMVCDNPARVLNLK
ncbi:MAG: DUF6282 family protein [Bacillota bacterium]